LTILFGSISCIFDDVGLLLATSEFCICEYCIAGTRYQGCFSVIYKFWSFPNLRAMMVHDFLRVYTETMPSWIVSKRSRSSTVRTGHVHVAGEKAKRSVFVYVRQASQEDLSTRRNRVLPTLNWKAIQTVSEKRRTLALLRFSFHHYRSSNSCNFFSVIDAIFLDNEHTA